VSTSAAEPESFETRILDAAKRQILERGMQKMRIEQIAAEVGLQRPNVYRYFPSKNALVLEVLISETREILRARRRQVPIKGPVAPLLVESLLLGFRLSQSTGVFSACLDEDSHQTAQLLTQPAFVTIAGEYWAPLLQHGRHRGEIDPDLDDDEIVRWFLGIQILLHEHPELFGGPDTVRDYLTKLAIPGVLTPRGVRATGVKSA
jgi:AcrR family transcriptional regulator